MRSDPPLRAFPSENLSPENQSPERSLLSNQAIRVWLSLALLLFVVMVLLGIRIRNEYQKELVVAEASVAISVRPISQLQRELLRLIDLIDMAPENLDPAALDLQRSLVVSRYNYLFEPYVGGWYSPEIAAELEESFNLWIALEDDIDAWIESAADPARQADLRNQLVAMEFHVNDLVTKYENLLARRSNESVKTQARLLSLFGLTGVLFLLFAGMVGFNLYRLLVERRRSMQLLQDTQAQLIQQEKLAALGELAGSVAHELRNPLGIISNAVYYLGIQEPHGNEKVMEYLEIITGRIQQAEKIVTEMINFASIQPARTQVCQLNQIVADALAQQPGPHTVQIEIDLPACLPAVFVDPDQVNQILCHLLVNAYQAMPDGGTLRICGQTGPGSVHLSLQDSGTGIPAEHLDQVFEPLYTTKVYGIGLGLAVCQRLARENGAAIRVSSQEGKGATFTLEMPLAPAQ